MDTSHIYRKRPCPEDWQQNERPLYYSGRAISHPGEEGGNKALDKISLLTNPYEAETEDLKLPPILISSSTWNGAQKSVNEWQCEIPTDPAQNAPLLSLPHSLSNQFLAQLDVQDIDMLDEPVGFGGLQLPEHQHNESDLFFQCHDSHLADPPREWKMFRQMDEVAIESSESPYLWDSAPGISPTLLHEDDLAISDSDLVNDFQFALEEDNDSGNCQEVCFGMIVGAHCRPFKGYLGKGQTESIEVFRLRYRAKGVTLLRSIAEEIGELDVRHGNLLKKLKDMAPGLRCEAYVPEDETLSRKAKSFPIEINVYGTMQEMESEPEPTLVKTEYRNPHVFSSQSGSGTPFFRMYEVDSREDLRNKVDATIHAPMASLFDTNIEVDSRIRSKLQDHQRQALAFMLLREQETVADDRFTLWKMRPQNGTDMYFHKLTYLSSTRRPTECRGGLLADEMGMGKSLSILTLIVSTQEDSLDFTDSTMDNSSGEIKARSRATLLITPKTTIHGWLHEIETHLEPSIVKAHIYHGNSKAPMNSLLKDFDVVITTFETATMESSSDTSLLKQISWFRIVLDEAHEIRNSSTLTFKAIEAFDAERRWCLTGTPIHNRLDDLFSLTRFLRFAPFDRPSVARKLITHPLQNGDKRGLDNLQSMMKLFSLRRIKNKSEVPQLHEHEISVSLCESERHHYDLLKKNALSKLAELARSNTTKTQHIKLQLELRLRQICCHGIIQGQDSMQSYHLASAICQGINATVVESTSVAEDPESALSHMNSSNYMSGVSEGRGVYIPQYPTHEAKVEPQWGVCAQQLVDTSPDADEHLRVESLSLKLAAVVSNLTGLNEIALHDPAHGEKSLVFSLWTTTLDVLGSALSSRRMQFVRIDGAMTLVQRRDAIVAFERQPDILIMLLTLGTGAVGLNLTVASQVHIVEPHWNPMMEEQAASRVHRLGQTREATVNHYIVKDSVEERIRRVQTRKVEIAELSVVRNKKSTT